MHISCMWSITISKCPVWLIDLSPPAMFVFVKGTEHLSLKLMMRQELCQATVTAWQSAEQRVCVLVLQRECEWVCILLKYECTCMDVSMDVWHTHVLTEESHRRSSILLKAQSRKAWLICVVTLWEMHADELGLNSFIHGRAFSRLDPSTHGQGKERIAGEWVAKRKIRFYR